MPDSDSSGQPLLLPAPQWLEMGTGVFELPDRLRINLQQAGFWKLGLRARQLLAGFGCEASIDANPAALDAEFRLWLNPALSRPEGYHLSIEAHRIRLEASDQAGLFYGLMSLKQLLRQFGRSLPQLQIHDWPDFAARGVMLDVSRDKVPSLATLKALADAFAEWKLNQLQLYTEHTFAYAGHETVWHEASPLTPQDILELDAYCAERCIELVPNQNSFGHLARWLKHPDYAHLGETGPEGFVHPLTQQRLYEPFSLCPADPGSLELMRDLYAQLLPHFRSRMFNIGADETFDLGQGRSAAACASQGKGQVYLDFLRQLHGLASAQGHLMQFWGDIILNHPELIPALPRPCIALNWGYEAAHPFEREGAHFAAAGIPYYVCPGTSSWNTIGGRADNMQGNLLHAARAGQLHAAAGYLITDWGDNGHWQPLPVSLPGFAYGAALAWASDANTSLPLARVLDLHVFQDAAGLAGEAWLELGTLYRLTGVEIHNQTSLFALLHWHNEPPGQGRTAGLTTAGLEAAIQVL
ncbi:MAG: glycoside hydrolase family 20 zincin-like fold domain-containing protein, partial [Candidatus Sericytochromatia bacterium]